MAGGWCVLAAAVDAVAGRALLQRAAGHDVGLERRTDHRACLTFNCDGAPHSQTPGETSLFFFSISPTGTTFSGGKPIMASMHLFARVSPCLPA